MSLSIEQLLEQPAREAVPRRRKRIIEDLRWARRSSRTERPRRMKNCTRAQREGIRFEKRFMKALARVPFDELVVGPWISFEDRNGFGICQPDAVAVTADGRPLVIEVKLTQTQRAVREVEQLYAPLVESVWGDIPRTCVAFRNWSGGVTLYGEQLDSMADLVLPGNEAMTLVDVRVT